MNANKLSKVWIRAQVQQVGNMALSAAEQVDNSCQVVEKNHRVWVDMKTAEKGRQAIELAVRRVLHARAVLGDEHHGGWSIRRSLKDWEVQG